MIPRTTYATVSKIYSIKSVRHANARSMTRHELKQVAQDIQDLDRRNASAKRGKQGKLFSKLECMQEYHAALKTLLVRFDHATNEQEGKDDFRYDIKQIEHDIKVVFAAGWENVKDIMAFGGFPRITGINNESEQPDASCSMLSMLRMDPATPHIMRSGRKIQLF